MRFLKVQWIYHIGSRLKGLNSGRGARQGEEERAMVKFGPRKVGDRGIGEVFFPRVVSNTPI